VFTSEIIATEGAGEDVMWHCWYLVLCTHLSFCQYQMDFPLVLPHLPHPYFHHHQAEDLQEDPVVLVQAAVHAYLLYIRIISPPKLTVNNSIKQFQICWWCSAPPQTSTIIHLKPTQV